MQKYKLKGRTVPGRCKMKTLPFLSPKYRTHIFSDLFAELPQQFLSIPAELAGRHHSHFYVLVASLSGMNVGNTLSPETEYRSCLGTWRYLHLGLAIDGRDLDLGTQSSLKNGYCGFTEYLISVPLELVVFQNVYHHVKITRRTASGTWFTHAPNAQTGPVLDSWGHLDIDGPLGLISSRTLAVITKILRTDSRTLAVLTDDETGHASV